MESTSTTVLGFDATGVAVGIKKTGALDLALIACKTPCRAAATFTRNLFPAAPVLYDRQLLAFNPNGIHAVLINSGCANACTGMTGNANAKVMAEIAAKHLDTGDQTVLIMSTGVIGVQLPMDKIADGIPQAVYTLRADGWADAAQAIMTTDTKPKFFSRSATVAGKTIHLAGISKGAGMIHPDMATMLSTIVTDAQITQPILQEALNQAVAHSYNRISIDGDTSTNDTVVLLANGHAENTEIETTEGPDFEQFTSVLTALCIDLSQAIVRDGEGVTKFVTIHVNGAEDDAAAHRAANTIATSPLVKTAFFGSDANWGRILAAVGRAGIRVEPDRCDLYVTGGANSQHRMPDLQLVAGGTPLGYQETDAAARFALSEIDVRVELGLGNGSATVWTSDLSHDYVSINGDYRS